MRLTTLASYLVLLLTGCGSTTAVTPDPSPAPAVSVPAPTASVTPPSDEPPAAPPRAPSESERGEPTVSGELQISKGNPVVGGRFLSHDAMDRFLGKDWRRHQGRLVRAWGTLDVYRCPPESQCLISGEIPRLKDATHIEWAEPADPEPCLAECEEASKRCDADARAPSRSAKSPRGGLRRCGSQRVSCREDCARGQ